MGGGLNEWRGSSRETRHRDKAPMTPQLQSHLPEQNGESNLVFLAAEGSSTNERVPDHTAGAQQSPRQPGGKQRHDT